MIRLTAGGVSQTRAYHPDSTISAVTHVALALNAGSSLGVNTGVLVGPGGNGYTQGGAIVRVSIAVIVDVTVGLEHPVGQAIV